MTDATPAAGQGQEGALQAMLDAINDPAIRADYRTMVDVFTVEDYRVIVDIAWRHQFNDDRLNFKRDIRELQQDIARRATDLLERS